MPKSDSRVYLPDDPRNIDFKDYDTPVRVMQIIVAALVIGVSFFIGVVLTNFKGFAGQLDILNWIGLGFAMAGIAMSFIVPAIISNASPSKQSSQDASSSASSVLEQHLNLFQLRLIIGCGILDGAAFLNAIVFQKEPHASSLAAAAVCIAFMLARFPTKSKVQNWLAKRLA